MEYYGLAVAVVSVSLLTYAGGGLNIIQLGKDLKTSFKMIIGRK